MCNTIQTRAVLGVPVHAVTMEQVLDLVEQAIRSRSLLQIGVVNAAKLVNMHGDPLLRRSVLASDLILADGMSVVWAARLLRQRLPERVTGIDLMVRLFERADERGYRIYCLGATASVLSRVASRIRREYPGAQLVGSHHGYFSSQEEPAIAEDIRRSQPDILLVAMTSPRKEQFLARWSRHIGVPVCHGVGGAFDVMAGKVRRAPAGWQRAGMEWLYRVLQEPRRLWRRYLVTNVLFSWMVLAEFTGLQRLVRRQS